MRCARFRFQYIYAVYAHPNTFDFWSPSHSPLNFLAAGLNSRVAAEFCVEFESYTDVTKEVLFLWTTEAWRIFFRWMRLRTKKNPREIRNCGFLNQSWRIHADSCHGFQYHFQNDAHESEVKPCFRSQVLPNKRHVQICQPRDLISVIAGGIVW